MTTLHLGVPATPYRHGNQSRTVFDVAVILEARYGIMEYFVDTHAQQVLGHLADSYANHIEAISKGAPSHNPGDAAGSKIAANFKSFLTGREMDGNVAGVPTAAALHGVSHRFRHPYARRPSRPSFIDTGLYQASFEAWVTGW